MSNSGEDTIQARENGTNPSLPPPLISKNFANIRNLRDRQNLHESYMGLDEFFTFMNQNDDRYRDDKHVGSGNKRIGYDTRRFDDDSTFLHHHKSHTLKPHSPSHERRLDDQPSSLYTNIHHRVRSKYDSQFHSRQTSDHLIQKQTLYTTKQSLYPEKQHLHSEKQPFYTGRPPNVNKLQGYDDADVPDPALDFRAKLTRLYRRSEGFSPLDQMESDENVFLVSDRRKSSDRLSSDRSFSGSGSPVSRTTQMSLHECPRTPIDDSDSEEVEVDVCNSPAYPCQPVKNIITNKITSNESIPSQANSNQGSPSSKHGTASDDRKETNDGKPTSDTSDVAVRKDTSMSCTSDNKGKNEKTDGFKRKRGGGKVGRRRKRGYIYDPKPLVAKTKTTLLPTEVKDNEYWDKRRRNNEAAKRSRENRRLKELETMGAVKELRGKNEELRLRIQELEEKNRYLENLLSSKHIMGCNSS